MDENEITVTTNDASETVIIDQQEDQAEPAGQEQKEREGEDNADET